MARHRISVFFYRNIMTLFRRWAILLFIICMANAPPVAADKLILNSGEEFVTNQIWEEGDIIRFSMHGLLVTVEKEDVKAIVRDPVEPMTPEAAAPDVQTAPPPPEEKRQVAPLPVQGQGDDAPHPQASVPADAPPVAPSAPTTRSVQGTGLSGLYWKAPPDSMAGLVKTATEPTYGGLTQYQRPGEDLRLGQTRLDGMVYGFWRDQLYTIMMWVEGRPGYQRLRETVNAYYGAGRPSASGLERYIWKDADTDRMLEFDENLNTGIFWMRSRDLDKLIKRIYPE
jgi:hypothetical protein